MPQVFQECGSPQPTPARARRAPAPREEVSRLWSAAAAEERPATAAGSSLPQLVSRGRAWRGRGRGRGGGRALQLRPALSLRPGVGAPRAAEPSERLLGRAAPGGVRGPPHGGGPLAGGGALLDRSWAGPVRAGRQWQRRRRAGGRPRGRGGAGGFGAALLAGTCHPWLGAPRLSTSTTQSWMRKPRAPTFRRGGGG